jgi:hypothetical protein
LDGEQRESGLTKRATVLTFHASHVGHVGLAAEMTVATFVMTRNEAITLRFASALPSAPRRLP